VLGLGLASTLFGLALLAAGVNSTVTGTLAGQIIMEGFLSLRLPAWKRRLLTRSLAIVPVIIIASLYGAQGVNRLLLASQVILSLQLPFAIVPLVVFVSNRAIMKEFAISRPMAAVAWLITAVVVTLNIHLLADIVMG
jgi:manganese transport protein